TIAGAGRKKSAFAHGRMTRLAPPSGCHGRRPAKTRRPNAGIRTHPTRRPNTRQPPRGLVQPADHGGGPRLRGEGSGRRREPEERLPPVPRPPVLAPARLGPGRAPRALGPDALARLLAPDGGRAARAPPGGRGRGRRALRV